MINLDIVNIIYIVDSIFISANYKKKKKKLDMNIIHF